MAIERSAAIGQRSLGDPSLLFPLAPPLLRGCPRTSTADMQFPLEIDFDYSKVSKEIFRQPPLPGLQRWAPLLPPLFPELSLGEGGTALIASQRMARWIGLDGPIWLKDESRNPTWSHKDRLNYCIVSTAVANGARGIAVASTGNHGAAAAAYAHRAGLRCVVISTPEAQRAFEHFQSALGSEFLLVPREERWPTLNRIVDETGFMPASNLTRFHTGNAFGPEGYKTIAYEIFSQLGGRVPGTVVLPTGYGELLFGVSKGFRELKDLGVADTVPQIFSAEPAGRAPLARAMSRNEAAAEVSGPASIAAGIACAVSSYRAVVGLRASRGRALTFHDKVLTEATRELAHDGLWQEFSGVAGLAALREAVRRGEAFAEPVVTVLTSTGLKEIPATSIVSSDRPPPSLDSVIASLKRA
ncbi:MAG: pyridoxal-phosphate dependent enzyme [Xanthobacteraceae bacterium]